MRSRLRVRPLKRKQNIWLKNKQTKPCLRRPLFMPWKRLKKDAKQRRGEQAPAVLRNSASGESSDFPSTTFRKGQTKARPVGRLCGVAAPSNLEGTELPRRPFGGRRKQWRPFSMPLCCCCCCFPLADNFARGKPGSVLELLHRRALCCSRSLFRLVTQMSRRHFGGPNRLASLEGS